MTSDYNSDAQLELKEKVKWMVKIRVIGLGLVGAAFLVSTVALKMSGPQLVILLVSTIVLLCLLLYSTGSLINLVKRKDRLLSQMRTYADNIINNGMNDLLLILNREGRITLLNEAGGRMLGYRPEEVVNLIQNLLLKMT